MVAVSTYTHTHTLYLFSLQWPLRVTVPPHLLIYQGGEVMLYISNLLYQQAISFKLSLTENKHLLPSILLIKVIKMWAQWLYRLYRPLKKPSVSVRSSSSEQQQKLASPVSLIGLQPASQASRQVGQAGRLDNALLKTLHKKHFGYLFPAPKNIQLQFWFFFFCATMWRRDSVQGRWFFFKGARKNTV